MNLRSLTFAFSATLAAAVVAWSPAVALAQDIEDIEAEGSKKKKDKDREEVVASDEIVREIERGWYLRANAGVASYFLRYGPTPAGFGSIVRAGSVVQLSVGNDFVDEPGRSLAWEFSFYQGVHQGLPFDLQVDAGVAPNDHVQGDIRTFGFLLSGEFSTYPSRRLGVGVRAGGGLMLTPLLMNKALYQSLVVGDAWNGANPPVHSTPHFPVFAGPTIEYYTKLSHFSVGIDADIMFVIGFDLGFNATGFMKYTF
jgi:hypothetical protein